MFKTQEKTKQPGRLKSFGTGIKLFFQNGYFKNKFLVWFLILGAVGNIADWLTIKIFLKPTFPIISLHYNVYFGVDIFGTPEEAYFLPMIGLIILAINFLLSFYFYSKKERIASYVLLMAGLMVQFGVLISIISIILINY